MGCYFKGYTQGSKDIALSDSLPKSKPHGQSAKLRVLATSDLHMNLNSFDYYTDEDSGRAGLSRLASVVKSLRKKAAEEGALTLLFDNGDSLQGGPLDLLTREAGESPHVVYRAFAAMGYDACGLGNHDFNFGLPWLAQSLTGAALPVLNANVSLLGTNELPIAPWTLLHRHIADQPIAIGVFSVLPPQTLIWDAHHLAGKVEIDDITEAAERAVEALKDAGADLIIALAHTGLDDTDWVAGQENALAPLSRIEGIDAILSGHQHALLPDPKAPEGSDRARGAINGTPVVMPAASGAFVGVIDLDLRKDGATWRVSAHNSQLVKVEAEADPEITALCAPFHQRTRTLLDAKIGETAHPLHSYFGFVTEAAAFSLMASAMADGVRRNLTLPEDLPLLAAVSPPQMGGRGGPRNYVDIPVGKIRKRDATNLCFFPNALCVIEVTGAQLRNWLEASVGIYAQIDGKTDPQLLLSPDRAAHSSDMIYGATYQIDLSQPARFDDRGRCVAPDAHRVGDLQVNGHPVRDADRFAVALTNYRANGGGVGDLLSETRHLPMPQLSVQDALESTIAAGANNARAWPCPFSFKPLGGQTAILATGPGATAHLADLGALYAETRGVNADGFLELTLTL